MRLDRSVSKSGNRMYGIIADISRCELCYRSRAQRATICYCTVLSHACLFDSDLINSTTSGGGEREKET